MRLPTRQSHHRHVDVAQGEVVHSEVWRDLYRHGGHDDSVVPELGVVQDVGQADQGDVLGEEGEGREGKNSELSFLVFVVINNAAGFPGNSLS